jgi:Rrf2 family protein
MAIQLISTASRLGLYALVMMADKPDELVSVGRVAEAFGASDNHVAKVLQQLSRSGLVASVRGAGGGYRLGRDASDIYMADVIEHFDGPLDPTCFGCEGRLAGACGHFAACTVRDVLSDLGQRSVRMLRETSIAKLARRGRKRSSGDAACLRASSLTRRR